MVYASVQAILMLLNTKKMKSNSCEKWI